MILSKVIGTVVATRKDERLVSNKLLIVQPFDPSGGMRGNQLVAVDTVDAGVGETVLVVTGRTPVPRQYRILYQVREAGRSW